MKTKTIFAAMALVVASGFASAETVNAGAITQDTSNPYVHIFSHAAGTFTDYVDFTIPEGSLQSSANPLYLSLGGVPTTSITNLAYSIIGGTSTSTGGTNYGSFLGNNTTYDLANIGSGAYHLVVNGLVSGNAGGAYAVSLVSGVPEPETYAMMLGGLGLLGFMARRRQKGAQA